MPATLCVPLRRSRSCPPPTMSGSIAVPSRVARMPTPLGPPNLWALSDIRSTCGHSWRRSSQHAAWTASVCSSARGACSTHDRGDGREVVDRADLVVDGHHADHRDVGVEGTGERVEPDACRLVDRDDRPIGPLDGVQHGMVLGRRAHGATVRLPLHGPGDGGVVALRAAAGEHDLARTAADDRGHAIAGLVDGASRVAGEAVRAARVGEALREERQHGVDRVLPHRRRRRVIEVHQPFHGRER